MFNKLTRSYTNVFTQVSVDSFQTVRHVAQKNSAILVGYSHLVAVRTVFPSYLDLSEIHFWLVSVIRVSLCDILMKRIVQLPHLCVQLCIVLIFEHYE